MDDGVVLGAGRKASHGFLTKKYKENWGVAKDPLGGLDMNKCNGIRDSLISSLTGSSVPQERFVFS